MNEKARLLSSTPCTTGSPTITAAGQLNINPQPIWIKEQSIPTPQQQMTTDVTLYAAYENKTPDRQEIFYFHYRQTQRLQDYGWENPLIEAKRNRLSYRLMVWRKKYINAKSVVA